jgi:hypothetical protein
MILPVSAVSSLASVGAFSARRSAKRWRSRPRCVAVRPAQSGARKARCAASTARSTSASVAAGMTAQGLPVEGSTLSNVSVPSSNRPSM